MPQLITMSSLIYYDTECPIRVRISCNPVLAKQLIPFQGSIAHNDGVILYSLIRTLKPKRVVELGTFRGISTNYMAAACAQNKVIMDTVDNVRYWGGIIRGINISWRYRRWIQQHKADAVTWLKEQPNNSIDFIFEDTSHTFENTRDIIQLAQDKLRIEGTLILHDVNVKEKGCEVMKAVKESALPFLCTTIEPGLQGLAIWRK